ncbi:hypothetical protein SIID45300_02682 [Candidatus Magnetaquicoccaceae bacterium FCR-1]|uniref:Glycosyltransferase 2-like domain-containing protein n=2 Tax=Candidatus Magnetaquiglobus chichijimensis TaxID=3141448 RepID=A0ABQ0CBR0_9PROT
MELSICIPTRNRGSYIASTIEKLIPQMCASVEIVVVDGASTDNTSEIIKNLKNNFSDININYIRLDNNGGVDADLKKAVQYASGRYCWFMSSDDHATQDSVCSILNALSDNPGILLFNRYEADRDMKIFGVTAWLPNLTNTSSWDFGSPSQAEQYLKTIKTIGAIFSYIPCIVVERKSWLESYSDLLNRTCYAHVYACLSLLLSGRRLKYLPSAFVVCRNDNDSFSSGGRIARYNIDFYGYLAISKLIKEKHREIDILQVVRREHRLFRLSELRSEMHLLQWRQYASKTLYPIGYGRLIVMFASLVGSSSGLIGFAKRLYHRAKIVYFKYKNRLYA